MRQRDNRIPILCISKFGRNAIGSFLSGRIIDVINQYLNLRQQPMNTDFSENPRNTEEIDFVTAVILGLIDIKEGNTYSLEEVKKDLNQLGSDSNLK